MKGTLYILKKIIETIDEYKEDRKDFTKEEQEYWEYDAAIYALNKIKEYIEEE